MGKRGDDEKLHGEPSQGIIVQTVHKRFENKIMTFHKRSIQFTNLYDARD
jgi:hypothetical protein